MRRFVVAVLLAAGPVVADSSLPRTPASAVPCRTVDDCWLDAGGHAIPRPRRLRGRPLPEGDCGKNLVWLDHQLTCEKSQCVARFSGDKC